MRDFVGMITRDLTPEGFLDGVGVGCGVDTEHVVVRLQPGAPFLNSVTFDAGNSRRSFCFPSRRPGRSCCAVVRAQYGQNCQPGCSDRAQPGQAPVNRLPQLGQARKSSPIGPWHDGQMVRISLTSVTTRSSSPGVVIPALTFASASSPRVIM